MIPYISLAILLLTMFLLVRNLKKYMDGNGQAKNRILLILQISSLICIAVSFIFNFKPVGHWGLLVISLNSLAFMMGWDAKVFGWVRGIFK